MNNFWNNLARYPRFFISSVSGSIIIILSPFLKGFRKQKWRGFSFLVLISIIFLLLTIVKNMTGI